MLLVDCQLSLNHLKIIAIFFLRKADVPIFTCFSYCQTDFMCALDICAPLAFSYELIPLQCWGVLLLTHTRLLLKKHCLLLASHICCTQEHVGNRCLVLYRREPMGAAAAHLKSTLWRYYLQEEVNQDNKEVWQREERSFCSYFSISFVVDSYLINLFHQQHCKVFDSPLVLRWNILC